ncbi:hypothetical protein VTK56DRAFT_3715 [Thermocarpiscus australiensis]
MEPSSDSILLSSDEGAPLPDHAPTPTPTKTKKSRGREATVYDAVAGRVTLNAPIGDSGSPSSRSKRRLSQIAGRYSSRNPRLAPEEVLFRRSQAPVRYAEQDIYWANEDLPDDGRRHLPEASLLRSIHAYASRFYDAAAARLGPRCVVGSRTVDERSMDETALLAFGILLEEASRDVLGKRGDLVFTEASTEPKEVANVVQAGKRSESFSEGARGVGEGGAPGSGRDAKRRKVAK